MAIVGLQNAPMLDCTLLRDSQSQGSISLVNEGRGHTPTSSLLQMWRGLEDDHVVSQTQEGVSERLLQQRDGGLIINLSRANTTESHSSEHGCYSENSGTSLGENVFETWSEGQTGSQNGEEDSHNFSCDFGEGERERVRQIFREWMNNGVKDCTSNVSGLRNGSRSESLGENDQDRVRIIREGFQKNSQQSYACYNSGEDQVSEPGIHIEHVQLNQPEGRFENARRGIRRLCGRQPLIDMLKKAELERQRDIQGLLEQQAVSRFAHRNRIQSLLKSRFLRNKRSIENDRPITVAESELGLLRRRQTVSDLREGFVSRLDSSVSDQVSGEHLDASSSSEIDHSITEQNEVSNFEILDDLPEQYLLMESHDEGSYFAELSDYRFDLQGNTVENVLESASVPNECDEQISQNEVRDWQSRDNAVELIDSRDNAPQNVDRGFENATAHDMDHETLQIESEQQTNTQDVLLNDPYVLSDEENIVHGTSNFEDNMPDGNWQQSFTQVERFQEHTLGNDSTDQQHLGVGYFELSNREENGRNQLENVANGLSQDLVSNDYGEDPHLQNEGEVWNGNDTFQAAVPNWIEGASNEEAVPTTRVEPLYFADDDNGYSTEIRELLSRRSVSNLLSSGFRESLDQLIQSYVDRQGHATNDWELDETSPRPALAGQDLERQVDDQNGSQGQGNNSGSSPHTLPSPPRPSLHPYWDRALRDDNWSQHDIHPRMGIDWEIINDMRIDMARLQQRMSNLQTMLEACMDMQLELQRSIRQEVSAALNRSAGSQGVLEHTPSNDASKWDHVRKGVCCICYNTNIDSLLYRCGHMCTCSKCAAELVQISGKCPMCRAPVVQVIRAYSQ